VLNEQGVPVPVLQVITASTRPGRRGIAVARWLSRVAQEHGGFDVELVDLAEVGLPVFDEPNHPRMQRYTHQHTKDWSATVSRGDAFVFVTPEYNHSFPASLKNALDFLSLEWADKPAGLVSYGGVSAGLRAAAALKPVLAALRVVPVVEAVSVPFFTQFLTEDDEFVPNAELEAGAKAMLDELARLTPALQRLRQAA
jgi:NAD(P)H-dependent FMN reductase